MQKLSFTITSEPNKDVIFLRGSIYEGTGQVLRQLSPLATTDCVFNFRDIEHTNTCGIQEWVEFMQEFNKERNVTFAECPASIVMLINMIPIFKGDAKIQSVMRSFFCEKCQQERNVLCQMQGHPPQGESAPCPSCKNPMAADIPSEEFFGFLRVDEA